MQYNDEARDQTSQAKKGLMPRLQSFARFAFIAVFAVGFISFKAFAAANPPGTALVNWAQTQIGSTNWCTFRCAQFVGDGLQAIGINPPRTGTAKTDYYYWRDHWQDHKSEGIGPMNAWDASKVQPGDIVFWPNCSWAGHVAIYSGNNTIINDGAGDTGHSSAACSPDDVGIITKDPATALCGTPAGFLSMGGAQCPAGQVSLKLAMDQIEDAIHPPASYAMPPGTGGSKEYVMGGGRQCAPNSCPPPNYSPNYDCSGLAGSIAKDVPGFAGSVGNTADGYLKWSASMGSTRVAPTDIDKYPVVWCFTGWGDDGPDCEQAGHTFVTVCGHTGNAHCHGCAPDIDNGRGNFGRCSTHPLVCYVPPGLKNLTMDSCSAACTQGGATYCGAPTSTPTDPGSGNDANTGGCTGTPAEIAHCQTTSNPGATCPGGAQCRASNGCGGNSCIGQFWWALGWAESGNSYSANNHLAPPQGPCIGKWQNCVVGGLNNLVATYCNGDINAWANNTNYCQDQGEVAYQHNNWNGLVSFGAKDLLCKTVNVKGHMVKVTQSGLMGAAQLCGVWGAISWIKGGGDAADANGTSCSQYFLNFINTPLPSSVPWADNSCSGQIITGGDNGCEPNPPPPPCGNPVLTGAFQHNPCQLPDPPEPPGQKFIDYLDKWWDEVLGKFKDMTTQIYAYRVFETWQLGRMTDAVNLTNTARLEQEQRIKSQQQNYPSEAVCTASSFTMAMAETKILEAPLTNGFKKDLTRRDTNVKEQAPYIDVSLGPAPQRRSQWLEYCTEFFDPNSNNGKTACPSYITPDPQRVINGDVSIEGLLLKDSIDLSNPHQSIAVKRLMTNLLSPHFPLRLPDSILTTPTGQETVIRQQHLAAINNIARDVVASIVSRRTAMPPADANIANIVDMIKTIRTNAGTDPASISDTPSYNEIMLAMTKERFFDPNYFYRVQNNPGTLKQEQASVDAYTAVELQDVYRMQEQINALLAARASMKLRIDKNPNQSPAVPLQ